MSNKLMVRLRLPSTLDRTEGLILNSYAKINLFLEVLNIRQDNYHNIKTIFERISLCDKVILVSRQDKNIKIICNFYDVPCNAANLAYQSVKLLQDSFKIDRGVDIKIIKRIPVGAGLGGGSSNAATVLMGLNKLWRLNLAQNKLIDFARKIGSDVPFFIYRKPFAQGTGRGDRIVPLTALNHLRLWHILAVPKIEVSTPLVYKKWDKYSTLTRPKYDAKILLLALKKKDFSLMGRALFNSLEEVTAKLYPQVRRLREKLMQMGLKSILMSGSGPAVFGIVSSRKEAQALTEQLRKENRLLQIFLVKTL